MRHTPGPWSVGANLEIFYNDGDVCPSVAQVELDNCLYEAQAQADARLIAAAPDMLDLIGRLLEWEEFTGGWEAPCWKEARDLFVKLEV